MGYVYYDVFVALTNDSLTENIISNFICFSIAEKLCKAISNNNIFPMMKPVRDGSLCLRSKRRSLTISVE